MEKQFGGTIRQFKKSSEIKRRSAPGISKDARSDTRTESGHNAALFILKN
jgi:hypothetical protein